MAPAAPVPTLCPDAIRSIAMPSLHLGTRGRARLRPVQRQARVQAASDPVLKKPESPRKPMEPEVPEEEGQPDAPPSDTITTTEGGVTIQWQRSQAKALVRYFEDLKFERIAQDPFFGWTKDNEIVNGRWVMFGIAVGLITEYATGVDFIHQVGLLVSYLGLADFQD